ncbi:MAG: alpha-ketoacid dehydrogenase subunit beta [Eubacterium sp.]|nr:alpha-ketoacid dehydrogenase subunit beta [Eubacterium sp.]
MKKIAYGQAVREAMLEEMQRDENVIIVGNQVAPPDGGWGINKGLVDLFGPERVVDMAIAENASTGLAIGAAFCGARPIVDYQMSDFMAVAYDPIAVHAGKWNYVAQGKLNGMPLVCRCGIPKAFGPHHSARIYNIFANSPGLKIVHPTNATDAKGLMKSAVRDNNPVLFFELLDDYAKIQEIPEEEYTVPIGKAATVEEGSDLTIVAFGRAVNIAKEALTGLKAAGISAELIDLRTLVPMDEEAILNSVKKTRNLLIAEEAPRSFSITGEIAFRVQNKLMGILDRPIERCTMEDVTVPTGPIEDYVLLHPEDIEKACRDMLGK